MIKTLSNIFKQDKEKFVIPRSVQQVIPIETIWSDGIFKIGRNKFARTYKFTDINYAVASKVDKCIRPLSAAIRAAFSGQTGPY